METYKFRSLSLLASFVLLLITSQMGVTAAFADSIPSAGLNAGTLSQALGFGSFGSTSLSGVSQALTGDMRAGVFDSRGAGSGWHLNLTIEPFHSFNSDGTATTVDHILDTSNTNMTLISKSTTQPVCVGASSVDTLIGYTSAVADPNCINGSVYSPSAILSMPFHSATDVMWAEANTGDTHYGMGNYAVTDTLAVTFPANAYAATYKTTITVAAVDGPGASGDFTHP